MGDELSWTLRLEDQITPTARGAARALKSVEKALKDAGRASAGRGSPGGGRGGLLGALGGRRGDPTDPWATRGSRMPRMPRAASGRTSNVFGAHVAEAGERMAGRVWDFMSGLASAATDAAVAVGRLGLAFGTSMVQQAAFRQGTLTTFRTILGSERAAQTEFDAAVQIARQTPFDVGQVIRMRRGLVTAGFRDSHDRDVVGAIISDLSAMHPEDSETMDRLSVAFSQIRGAGRLRGQELLQLRNAGVDQGALFAEIGRARHLHGNETSINRQVQALMEHGRVSDTQTFTALAASLQRLTGMQVGGYSRAQSDTLTGRLSNAGGLWTELVSGGAVEQTSGIQAFSGALGNLNEALNGSSDRGKQFRAVLYSFSDTLLRGVFGDLSGPQGAQRLDRVLGDVLSTGRTLGGVFERLMNNVLRPLFGGAFEGFRRMLPTMTEGLQGLGKNDPAAFERLGSAIGMIAGAVVWLGTALGSASLGNWEWLTKQVDELAGVWTALDAAFHNGGVGLGSALWDGFRFYIAHTPIGLFFGAGEEGTIANSGLNLLGSLGNGAEGFRSPDGQRRGEATAAADDLLGSVQRWLLGEERAAPTVPGGRGGVHTGDIHVHLGAAEGDDPQSQGEQVGQAAAGVIRRQSE